MIGAASGSSGGVLTMLLPISDFVSDVPHMYFLCGGLGVKASLSLGLCREEVRAAGSPCKAAFVMVSGGCQGEAKAKGLYSEPHLDSCISNSPQCRLLITTVQYVLTNEMTLLSKGFRIKCTHCTGNHDDSNNNSWS